MRWRTWVLAVFLTGIVGPRLCAQSTTDQQQQEQQRQQQEQQRQQQEQQHQQQQEQQRQMQEQQRQMQQQQEEQQRQQQQQQEQQRQQQQIVQQQQEQQRQAEESQHQQQQQQQAEQEQRQQQLQLQQEQQRQAQEQRRQSQDQQQRVVEQQRQANEQHRQATEQQLRQQQEDSRRQLQQQQVEPMRRQPQPTVPESSRPPQTQRIDPGPISPEIRDRDTNAVGPGSTSRPAPRRIEPARPVTPAPTQPAQVHATQPHTVYTLPPDIRVPANTSSKKITPVALAPAAARRVISQVNLARSHMSGLNRGALPQGTVSATNRGLTLRTAQGRTYSVRPNGTLAAYKDKARSVNFTRAGKVRGITATKFKLRRGPAGERHIIVQHPGNIKVVGFGEKRGYVEHTVLRGRVPWHQRHHRRREGWHTRYYRPRSYGGHTFYWYEPNTYYDGGFYSWVLLDNNAFNFDDVDHIEDDGCGKPLILLHSFPDVYAWISEAILRQLRVDECDEVAGESSETGYAYDLASTVRTPITDALRAELAARVEQEIEDEQAEAAEPATDAAPIRLDLGQLSLATYAMGVSTAQGDCGLTDGDMLRLDSLPGPGGGPAMMEVVRGRLGDCPAGVQVQVPIEDVIEMENDLRALIDEQLAYLYGNNGRFGFPQRQQSFGIHQFLPQDPQDSAEITEDGKLLDGLPAEEQQQEDAAGAAATSQ